VLAQSLACPALQHIAVLLRLSPDIAGITLLAFASGAPDIFTELAAINGGTVACPRPLFPIAVRMKQPSHSSASMRVQQHFPLHKTYCCCCQRQQPVVHDAYSYVPARQRLIAAGPSLQCKK